MAENLIYQGVAPSGAETEDSSIQDKMAKYLPSRGWGEDYLLSPSRELGRVKTSSELYPLESLPRLQTSIPFVDKVASTAYSVYVANLLESEESPTYTKLASLISEETPGTRTWVSRPWTTVTLLALNRHL